ncbi:MAG: DNA replication/repair protein RecF [Actinomycetota bacterium]|nr:DNA replication/repair protein RecF [Actinomycetota bacterium]
MHLRQLVLHDFRSWAVADLAVEAGPVVFVGPNGQGKTNLVEAVGYLATLGSHRVATDAPLVRQGAERAVVRARFARDDRELLVECEISPAKANRVRVNRSPLPRPRELLGLVRTVLFAPEDLALVRGDPSERRRFLDELLITRSPRFAGIRQDYDRVLKQRNALLKTARHARGDALSTLDIWDGHVARVGAELLAGRLGLVADLGPYVSAAYAAVAGTGPEAAVAAGISYESTVLTPDTTQGSPLPIGSTQGHPETNLAVQTSPHSNAALTEAIGAALARVRGDELDRGITLVGPHRDELRLRLGGTAAKGYASHGESWSFALALKLGAYDLLRADGVEPILILDDVFAELDTRRRAHLSTIAAAAEQTLITAAVSADVPETLRGMRFEVADGKVQPIV